MAKETLPAALKLMFGHEGGYSNHPSDPGGPTKYGVTLKTLRAHRRNPKLTAEDVKALTLAEAEDVYHKSYWTQSGGDLLPAGLDYSSFDYGVNSGPATAIKRLQKVLGIGQDGIVGGQTLAAIDAYPGGLAELIVAYAEERMRYLRGLGTWGKFGRGWTIRVTGKDPKGQYKPALGVVGNSLRMAAGRVTAPSASPVGTPKAPPSDAGIAEILKKPEAWAPLGGLLSAVGGMAAGAGPVQWALAVVLVAGVGYGLYRLVKRERATA
ncbi:glycoside hydrolase family 108 protein [Aminobacter sp. AP02]|uniref:glycoside hydrolase family 108 protein n=1 Tax=Aminobacter sp. AP02 TaxID=2135737 RepID=UPI000D6B744B|nr:glycoside hydrolase family 108 protein [Aminobacter sp. AP02]PWK65887.1 lysozyme family protein [Aminobacter sp. AP02]